MIGKQEFDREYPLWFLLGTREDGTADVSWVDGDVFIRLPVDVAKRVVAARTQFVDVLADELGMFVKGGGHYPEAELVPRI